MNTRIDLAKCDGYANCVVEADEVFDIDEATGQAVVLLPTIPAERADEVQRAQAKCPAQAIIVTG